MQFTAQQEYGTENCLSHQNKLLCRLNETMGTGGGTGLSHNGIFILQRKMTHLIVLKIPAEFVDTVEILLHLPNNLL